MSYLQLNICNKRKNLPPLPPRPNSTNSGSVDQFNRLPKALILEEAVEREIMHGRCKLESEEDLRKLRRTVSNRLSAQRSRDKKIHYVQDLENKSKDLQEMLIVLNVQKQNVEEAKQLLLLENDCLRTKYLEAAQGKIDEDNLAESSVKQSYPCLSFYESRLEDIKNNSTLVQAPAVGSSSNTSGFRAVQPPTAARATTPDGVMAENIDQYLNLDTEMMDIDDYYGFSLA